MEAIVLFRQMTQAECDRGLSYVEGIIVRTHVNEQFPMGEE